MTPPSTSCHGQKRRDTKKSVAEGVSTEDRLKLFRLIEKLAFESRDVVSNNHGGGSPETHKMMVLQRWSGCRRVKASRTAWRKSWRWKRKAPTWPVPSQRIVDPGQWVWSKAADAGGI